VVPVDQSIGSPLYDFRQAKDCGLPSEPESELPPRGLGVRRSRSRIL